MVSVETEVESDELVSVVELDDISTGENRKKNVKRRVYLGLNWDFLITWFSDY